MKGVLSIAVAATLAAGVVATPQAHGHRHQHPKKHEHGSPVEKRELKTVYETPMVTVYEIGGSQMDAAQAEQGIKDGLYSVIGETTPTFVPPPPPSTTATPSSSSAFAAEFIEQKHTSAASSSSTVAPPAPTTVAVPTTSSPAAVAVPATSAAAASSTPATGTGVDSDFPDGTIDCSHFPSEYGAMALTQTAAKPWAGLLDVGSFTPGIKIASFSEPSGAPGPGMFATYACPAGYDMAQWPETSQGATGQSVGGIYCGADNKLHLTRADKTKKLCMKGAGGVYVKNTLSEQVCICKTQYPGTESMVLPTCVQPGQTAELYNPIQSQSYVWEGGLTSSQLYVNRKGVSVEDACVWDPPANLAGEAGNWAPVNMGTSQDATGNTYLGLLYNHPTSTGTLDFNIAITGDVTGSQCSYDSASNTISNSGCTVGKPSGGTATIVFS